MDEKLKSENHSYYVAIVNVFAVILCIVYFCIYFILWAVVSAGYPALFSSSYFERINDDENMQKRAVFYAYVIF